MLMKPKWFFFYRPREENGKVDWYVIVWEDFYLVIFWVAFFAQSLFLLFLRHNLHLSHLWKLYFRRNSLFLWRLFFFLLIFDMHFLNNILGFNFLIFRRLNQLFSLCLKRSNPRLHIWLRRHFHNFLFLFFFLNLNLNLLVSDHWLLLYLDTFRWRIAILLVFYRHLDIRI